MIIQKDGDRVLQAGTFRAVSHDEWSISIDVYGIDEQTGDGIIYRVALSNGEVNAIARYCGAHGLQRLLDPTGLKPDPL